MRNKKEIRRLLEENRYHELSTLIPEQRKLVTLLISLSYDRSDVVSWRAMEAIGLITAGLSGEDPEFVRNVVNRLLWMIRDESGGIGWSCPDILGEIVRNNPDLCGDIATVVASFHDEEMLRPGVMLAIGRIGNIHSYFYDFAAPIVTSYLNDPDPATRAYAAYAAGELNIPGAAERLEGMRKDTHTVPFYEGGVLKDQTAGKIADTALSKLRLNAMLKTTA